MTKDFDLIKEGIIEKISYESRAYEPVDDWNHFYVIAISNINGKQNWH